jgi:transposase InsO family protein
LPSQPTHAVLVSEIITSPAALIRVCSGRVSSCEKRSDMSADTNTFFMIATASSQSILDESVQRLGLRVLKSPPRSPTANAICERVIGTIRRECLDWLIPLSEAHLRQA